MTNDLTILLIGTFGMLTLIIAFIAFAYLYQKKMRAKEREKQEIESLLKDEELKSAYAILETQDQERDRIANDLHDRMGGQLSTLKIYVDLLNQEKDEKKRCELLEKMNEGLQHSIHDIRNIAHDLSSATLKHYGLKKAIEHLEEAINDSGKVEVKYHLSVHVQLENQLVRDIYLIVQELTNNALKHSKADTIRIELTAINGDVNLIFEDNGIGFSDQKNVGLGLESIYLRVQRYEGEIQRESSPKNGTSYVIEIPLKDGP